MLRVTVLLEHIDMWQKRQLQFWHQVFLVNGVPRNCNVYTLAHINFISYMYSPTSLEKGSAGLDWSFNRNGSYGGSHEKMAGQTPSAYCVLPAINETTKEILENYFLLDI